MDATGIATIRRPLTQPPTPLSMDEWAQWQRVAHAEARRRLFRPLVAEEVAEQALFELVQLHLHGRPPVTPTAWLRGVVRNLAARWLASADARCVPLTLGSEDADEPQGAAPETMRCSIASHAEDWHRQIRALQPRLERSLTARQLRVLVAVRAGHGLRAAARACGMTPRDFRGAMRRIAAKAKALLGAAVPDAARVGA
jgi:DNA-directed RNA polymerase specialized sigma24 family protein